MTIEIIIRGDGQVEPAFMEKAHTRLESYQRCPHCGQEKWAKVDSKSTMDALLAAIKSLQGQS